MVKRENNLNESEALKAELIEAKRIEEFLRSENKNLWSYINNIQKLPFFNSFILISQKIKRIRSFSQRKRAENLESSSKKYTTNNSINKSFNNKEKEIDVLFVIPNNKIEIGGIQTSFNLAKVLLLSGISTKIISIIDDPTSENSDLFLNQVQLNEIKKINTLIVCGAESVDLANRLSAKFNSKRVLLMQGPDHYFTPEWENSKNFISAIQNFEYIITVSNFLSEIAQQMGAKNTICIPLGYDENIFKFEDKERFKQIVIPCRTTFEKGLKILLPQIPEIRKKGWRVVGFGDLANPRMAEVFDEFSGRINKIKMQEIFSVSRILLDPSLMEGLGLIPLEAAAAGVVSIITKRHSYEGLFKDNGFPFIEIDDFQMPNNVIDAIEKAMSMNPKVISDSVKNLNWKNGSLHFVNVVKEFLTN
jgi:hypothetical protein